MLTDGSPDASNAGAPLRLVFCLYPGDGLHSPLDAQERGVDRYDADGCRVRSRANMCEFQCSPQMDRRGSDPAVHYFKWSGPW